MSHAQKLNEEGDSVSLMWIRQVPPATRVLQENRPEEAAAPAVIEPGLL